jgi:hypothetical protein
LLAVVVNKESSDGGEYGHSNGGENPLSAKLTAVPFDHCQRNRIQQRDPCVHACIAHKAEQEVQIKRFIITLLVLRGTLLWTSSPILKKIHE